MKTILCVEDEPQILEHNKRVLSENGYSVLTAGNLSQAREILAKTTPDAIVLDIMLPDGNGLDLLTEIRSGKIESCNTCTDYALRITHYELSKVPIIMLTAWNRSYNKAYGLDAGADDYMGKPFEYDELLARIRKILKQAERVPEKVTRGALSLNVVSGTAYCDGVDLLLTKKEFAMLLIFVQNENRYVGAEYLYEKIWGQDMNDNANAVKTTVSRLRKKIDNSGFTITYGKDMDADGYCFEESAGNN